ncbi:MAG: hypothetical protein K0S65_1213 [Labilithrix sp.]|nr:hypothetical protein [Labilithrix sp.]
MSPKEKIAKLESLLARVKERAEAPRPHGAAAFPAPVAQAAAPALVSVEPAVLEEPAHLAHHVPTAPPPPASKAGTVPPPSGGVDTSAWSEPPPETSADPVLETSEDDSDMDVEVSSEVVEIDIDEPGFSPAESGAQPVADHANGAAEAELQEVPEELPAHASVPPEPEPEPELEPAPPPANEVVEPAPSSSPRPIASEQPETYEEESAPRHTPPPESGKQVAAPSAKPEPARISSSPPPSLEGHTLIGGWREPGMALPRSPVADLPRGLAVRVPPPPPPPPPAAPVAAPAPVEMAAPREPARLTAEVTKAELPASAQVAVFEGSAASFAPSTFGELLDATLGI